MEGEKEVEGSRRCPKKEMIDSATAENISTRRRFRHLKFPSSPPPSNPSFNHGRRRNRFWFSSQQGKLFPLAVSASLIRLSLDWSCETSWYRYYHQ